MNEEELLRYQIAKQQESARDNTDMQMALHAPTLQEQYQQNQAVVIAEVNPKKIVEDTLLTLEGKERKEDGSIVEVSEPYMNRKGMRMVELILKGLVNQHTTLSHLDEREIEKIILQIADDLTIAIGIGWKDYGIQDHSMKDSIMNMLIINSLTALKRAQEQNEKNWLGRISFESIQSQKPPEKKEGWLKKLSLTK